MALTDEDKKVLKEVFKFMDDTGYSPEAAAALFGVNHETMRRLLRGEGIPRRTTVKRFQVVLESCLKDKWGKYTGEKGEERTPLS